MKNLIAIFLLAFSLISCSSEISDNSFETLSGSYATLLVVDDYLYAINNSELSTFSIINSQDPVLIDKQNIGFDIENIFHNKGVLFIGSASDLHIFSIGDNGIPVRNAQETYFIIQNGCSKDPVISNDTHAFVTLSTILQGPCTREEINELRIYDVTDINNPILESITPLAIPKGLALVNNTLFVCEAKEGFAVIDVTDVKKPTILTRIGEFSTYDVIAKDDLLMVVGPKEIRQYDISNIESITFLSRIDL